jgi:hypothetical protein
MAAMASISLATGASTSLGRSLLNCHHVNKDLVLQRFDHRSTKRRP